MLQATQLKLAFYPYRRSFRQPLQTAHGLWTVREGIVLCLSDALGRVGYGEIAPVPWFGSETLTQALEFCRQCSTTVTAEQVQTVPEALPACQFGFGVAWEALHHAGVEPGLERVSLPKAQLCALLPTGAIAVQAWRSLWAEGYCTFKWKIAVADLEEELGHFRALTQALPPGAKLRLDANGGLDLAGAKAWLAACDRAPVEYLEQPLPPDQVDALLALQTWSQTPIALDESVATLRQLQAWVARGWQGVLVIKPAIAGAPAQLRQLCQARAVDVVFSSCFETMIGQQAGLRLAMECGHERAVGFGLDRWFDSKFGYCDAPFVRAWLTH